MLRQVCYLLKCTKIDLFMNTFARKLQMLITLMTIHLIQQYITKCILCRSWRENWKHVLFNFDQPNISFGQCWSKLVRSSGDLGLYSLRRRRLISIGIPIVNLRRSSDRLRFIMGIPIPVRRRLLVNRGPDLMHTVGLTRCRLQDQWPTHPQDSRVCLYNGFLYGFQVDLLFPSCNMETML